MLSVILKGNLMKKRICYYYAYQLVGHYDSISISKDIRFRSSVGALSHSAQAYFNKYFSIPIDLNLRKQKLYGVPKCE